MDDNSTVRGIMKRSVYYVFIENDIIFMTPDF